MAAAKAALRLTGLGCVECCEDGGSDARGLAGCGNCRIFTALTAAVKGLAVTEFMQKEKEDIFF